VSASASISTTDARGRRRTGVALAAAAVIVLVALVVVAARGPAGPPTFQERVHQVAKGLRCPVCQNLSVADSPSELAGQMRTEIALRLRHGETEQQIDAFFAAKYGRWILLTPSAGGVGLFVWLAPALAIAVGAGIAWSAVRRRRRPATTTAGAMDFDERPEEVVDDEPRLTAVQRAEVQREVDALDLRDDG